MLYSRILLVWTRDDVVEFCLDRTRGRLNIKMPSDQYSLMFSISQSWPSRLLKTPHSHENFKHATFNPKERLKFHNLMKHNLIKYNILSEKTQISCRHTPYSGNKIAETTYPWWRHQVETFSALLALCAGNSPVTPHKGQWRGIFSLICALTNGWANNGDAGV